MRAVPTAIRATVICALGAGPLLADEPAGPALAAIGRVEVAGSSYCTGTLIDDRTVLTAAHCLYDRASGQLHPIASVAFRAGLREGRATANRAARAIVVDPDWAAADRVAERRVAHDIGLIALDRPIRVSEVQALPVGQSPQTGADVDVLSYGANAGVPQRQSCAVTGRDPGGALTLSCRADAGASGAPVMMRAADGALWVAGVISGSGTLGGAAVALSGAAEPRMERLRALLAAEGTGGAFSAGGARRVRP